MHRAQFSHMRPGSKTQSADALEVEQGKLRLVIVVLLVIYFLVMSLWDRTFSDAEVVTLVSTGTVLFVDTIHFGWILAAPGINPVRRVSGAVLDMGAISIFMVAAGETGAVLFGLYLWVAIGNGFRYGRWYLHCAQALAMGGFAVVVWRSEFWWAHPMIVAAVFIALLAVPFYVSLLVARLQQARSEAEAANVAKTKFLAAASHDLRQPMQALSMYTTVLEQRVKDANTQSVVHGIQLSVTTLERMFDSLLDIARIESGVIKPNFMAFELMPIIERVVEEEAPMASNKGLDLRLVPTSVSVNSDPALLERMIKNLVTNAIRYTERGKIVIGCRRSGINRVRLDVVDSGIGIAVGDQARIFDEYYQIAGSSAQGLGLGLPIVKSLGSLLGHSVSVRSAPGRGSVFSIELTRAPDVGAIGLQAAVAADMMIGLNVALVDDDVEIRRSTELLLQTWGCHTFTASTGIEIEERLRAASVRPDALIVDYRLAETSTGVEVIERLRSVFGAHVPALIITGTVNPALLEQCAGGIPFAIKPLAPGRLRAFLSQALRTTSGVPA